ncbi:MAG: glycosyltransferase family 4 protein [Phycisphaerales bacterium]
MDRPPLLIAEAANPEWASVPLVGWSHARAVQALVGGHLVTQIRNAAAFERAGVPAGEYTAIDSERVAAGMYRLGERLRGGAGRGWTTVMALTALPYYYFEKLLWQQFGDRIRAGEFSLVHRITPLSPTMPSIIAKRCAAAGVPFVLGPLNGGVPWPREFDRARRREREWLSYVRGVYKLLPGHRTMLRHASAIICGSRHTQSEIPNGYQGKTVYVPENAVDPARFAMRRERAAGIPIRCVFIGRLVPYKGADMLIEAAAPLAAAGRVVISIVGDGPERARLESMVRERSIESAVSFVGQVPHTEVQRHLAESDLLTFPSIREFGGGVILEAMAVGVPPMAVAYAGPGELMTEQTGFPVAIGPRDEIVSALRSRLESVAREPGQIDSRSAACRARVDRLFTWEAKARQTLEVYRWVLGERADKPAFDFAAPEAAEERG